MPDRGEHALDRVGRPQVGAPSAAPGISVLGREVVEGQQRVLVLGQAGDRLFVLGAILLGERRDGCLRRRPVRRVSNLAQVRLGRRLYQLSITVAILSYEGVSAVRWPGVPSSRLTRR